MELKKEELGKNSCFICKKECSKREREMGAIKRFVKMVGRERERVTAE